jgi:hypothetical protein
MNADGTNIRQIAFEQDHTYNPTVVADGRILYLRWDYTDTPHVWNRVLFTMNPDGTGQSEFYGSNSYWPNQRLCPCGPRRELSKPRRSTPTRLPF